MKLKDRLDFFGDPLFLIDGSAFVYRGFYANRHLKRSDGFPTNAIFLVTRLILKILREQQPKYLLFVLDGKGKNFRHEIYPQYKANRPPMPDELSRQIEPLLDMLKSLGVPVEISHNCEADDCMAAIARKFSATMPVILVSGDKDLKQCLNDNTIMWDPASKDEKILTKNELEKETGITPEHWPDVQALIGDTADNIPGVPGIGPKTALQIFAEYPSLEEIKKHFALLPQKIRTKLEPHLEDMFRWRDLTTLKTDVCANIDLSAMEMAKINQEACLGIARKFELASIAREILNINNPPNPEKNKFEQINLTVEKNSDANARHETISSSAQLPDCAGKDVAIFKNGAESKPLVAVKTDSNNAKSFLWHGKLADLCVWIAAARKIITPDLKYLLRQSVSFSNLAGETGISSFFDLELAAYLLNPESDDYSWQRIASAWQAESGESSDSDPSLAIKMAAGMTANLKTNHLLPLYEDIEIPLVPVLAKMEERGITIDPVAFQSFLTEVNEKLDSLTESIYNYTECQFNIRSARQLGEILSGKLGLSTGKRTRTGQLSTTQASLEKLAGAHPVVDKILEYRKLAKLQTTYLEPLPRLMDAQNRVHSTFNQKATATGRISSSNPNLQNIPVRGDLGKRMRACFIAPHGKLLLAADYSQIELRVLAHLSQDKTLLEAFRKGEDIHLHTAALIFETSADNITKDQRRIAKTINFGLLYGMGARKLAQELKISESEASKFIERYFASLGDLKHFYEEIVKKASDHGYVSTMAGRIRWTGGITSSNGQIASQARRQAVNTVIQGTAADIIKIAMIHVANDPVLSELEALLVLQIHDELLLEVPASNAEKACQRVAKIMENVKPGGCQLSIPLAVDCGIGKNWAEAH